MSIRKLTFAYDVAAANPLQLHDQFARLEEAGCTALHFEVLDGTYGARMTFGPDLVRAARQACGLPCVVHLLTRQPDQFLPQFLEAGADTVILPAEARIHLHRALTMVRAEGRTPAVSLHPGTPLTRLEYLLDFVDRVMVLNAEPGVPEPAPVPGVEERAGILHENITHRRLRVQLAAAGALTPYDIALLARVGVTHFVVATPPEQFNAFRMDVEARRRAV
jgi:ribulose-phosphate 3-epimerase